MFICLLCGLAPLSSAMAQETIIPLLPPTAYMPAQPLPPEQITNIVTPCVPAVASQEQAAGLPGVPANAIKKWSGANSVTPAEAASWDSDAQKQIATKVDCVSQPNVAPVATAPVDADQNQNTVAQAAPSGPPGPPMPFKQSGFVEAGGGYSAVTHNQGDWISEYLKGELQTDPSNRWNAQVVNSHEFKDDGVFLGLGELHDFDDKWYSSLGVGGSTGGFFLPQYRIDGSINRKWLDTNQLVTTLGAGYYKARDVHDNKSLFLGAAYYFQEPWIVQAGITFNDSNPGAVHSTYQSVSVTQGTQKDYLLTLTYGFGKEAYQIVGPSTSISDFHSQSVAMELRKWLVPDWGFDARGEFYHNPTYNRTGMTLGVFHDF